MQSVFGKLTTIINTVMLIPSEGIIRLIMNVLLDATQRLHEQ